MSSADFKKAQHRVRAWLRENISVIQRMYPSDSSVAPCSDPRRSERDASIYTGAGGNAYLHWKLCRFYENEGDVDRSSEHLVKALEAVNVALLLSQRRHGTEAGVAFYCGSTGSGQHGKGFCLQKGCHRGGCHAHFISVSKNWGFQRLLENYWKQVASHIKNFVHFQALFVAIRLPPSD